MPESPPAENSFRTPPPLGVVNRRRIVYSVLLLGSAVLLFEGTGLVVGPLVLGAWAYVFACESRPIAFGLVLLLGVSLVSCLFCVLPAVNTPRDTGWKPNCRNNMKQIMLALYNYQETYGSYPPAYVADAEGKPMHSWRVLLLPYLEEQELYDEYDFDEPWDSEVNRQLLRRKPYVYSCPSHEDGDWTSYVAVVHPESCWPGAQGRALDEIADGTSNTVMVIESDSVAIPWTEPRDLGAEEAIRLLGAVDPGAVGAHRHEDFFYENRPLRHVALADGSVRAVPHDLEPGFARRLLSIADGGPGGEWGENIPTSVPYRKLRVWNVVRFGLFALLAVLPVPWVWLNSRAYEGGISSTGAG